MQTHKKIAAVLAILGLALAMAWLAVPHPASTVTVHIQSTSTDMANLTTSVTAMLMGLLPLVVTLLVIGFIFGFLQNAMFQGFQQPAPRSRRR